MPLTQLGQRQLLREQLSDLRFIIHTSTRFGSAMPQPPKQQDALPLLKGAAATIADATAEGKPLPPVTRGRASWIYAPMQLPRRIVFYLLVLAYACACPLAIGYALGYLVRPGAARGIVKTGLVSVASTPPGASVYIGKSRYTDKTPTTLRDLLPGVYPVSVLLKGHRPWRRDVAIRPGRAVVLEHLLLLPDTLPDTLALPGAFDTLVPIAARDLLLLGRGPRLDDLRVYDLRLNTVAQVLPPGQELGSARIRSTVTARNSPGALLRVHSRAGDRWLWVEPRREEVRVRDVTALLGAVPAGSRPAAPALAGDGVRGLGLDRRRLLCLTADGALRVAEPEHPLLERFVEDPGLGAIAAQGGHYQIRMLSDDSLLFIGELGELLTTRPPYLLVGDGVRDVVEDPRRGRALVWQADQLGVLDLVAWRAAPERAAPAWVYQDGRDLQEAYWVHDGSYVLFRDDDRVRLLELDAPGPRPVVDVVQVKKNSAIAYFDDWGLLYYLDRVTGDLRTVELVPDHAPLLRRVE